MPQHPWRPLLLLLSAWLLLGAHPGRAAQVGLAWDCLASCQQPPPEQFVIQRRLAPSAPWTTEGTVPGQLGSAITWTDPNVPATVKTVQYQVLTQVGTAVSGPSNVTTAVLGYPRLAATAVTVHSWDSQELEAEPGAAVRASDGNTTTIWATEWKNASPPPPHWIILDLGQAHHIDGLAYLPRQDGTNGTIGEYNIEVSADRTTWHTVASGTWAWPTMAEQSLRFPAAQGRYVRLTALREIQGGPWTSAAEIGIFAVPVSPPTSGVQCVPTQPDAKTLVITCTFP